MILFLFWTYIATIFVFVIVIFIIIFAWRHLFPQRWLQLLIISFTATIVGLCVLLIGELQAPYNSNFYINPFLYIIYFGLTGCSLFAIYLLVLEIHFKHIKLLLVIGCLVFVALILLLIIGGIFQLTSEFSSYIWIIYIAFECTYGLGIVAYVLLAIGSLKSASSDRLEQQFHRGLIIVGIFSIGIAFGLTMLAIGLLYVDFSVALNPLISVYWLLWMILVAILFLLMIRKAVSFIT